MIVLKICCLKNLLKMMKREKRKTENLVTDQSRVMSKSIKDYGGLSQENSKSTQLHIKVSLQTQPIKTLSQ